MKNILLSVLITLSSISIGTATEPGSTKKKECNALITEIINEEKNLNELKDRLSTIKEDHLSVTIKDNQYIIEYQSIFQCAIHENAVSLLEDFLEPVKKQPNLEGLTKVTIKGQHKDLFESSKNVIQACAAIGIRNVTFRVTK